MRTTIRKILFISCTIVLAMNSSCKKFLEETPINTPFGNEFWSNETSARSGLAGAYALFRTAMVQENGFIYYGDLSAGLFDCTPNNNWVRQQIIDGKFNGSYLNGLQNWSRFYKVIMQCNYIEDRVPTISNSKFTSPDPDKVKARMVAEARFIRSLTYFYMVRIWGDVPLQLKPVYDYAEATNIARTNQNTVLDQCIKDAQQAALALDWTYEDDANRSVQANKGAASALLAHIYAWRNDPAKSLDYANDITTNGDYTLVQPTSLNDTTALSKIFVKGQSREGIFEINISYSQNESQKVSDGGLSQVTLMDPIIPGKDQGNVVLLNKAVINNLYDVNDKLRRKAFLGLMNTSKAPLLLKYANLVFKTVGNTKVPYSDNDIIIFRLADIILLKAENLAKLGRYGEARIELNKIRARVFLPGFTGDDTTLADEIMNERERELIGEGHNWYDMLRNKKYPSWLNAGRYAASGWAWPVDPALFANNPLLQQTGYWIGKM